MIEINAIPIVDEKTGRVTHILGAVKDITKRKQSEQALKESELKYRELSATKDKFFSIISHDLKNPFNIILGFSSHLVENIYEEDIEVIKKEALEIYSAAKNTFNLLENLLLWSKSQSGNLSFCPEIVNLRSVFQYEIETIKNLAEIKNIGLEHLLYEDVQIIADQNMVRTILRNLLTNAIKYTNNGGKVTLFANMNNGHVEITVADNGIGIEEDYLLKLFQIGVTSKPGTAKEKGTGLGLMLCKEFVEKHNGRIWVESKEGKGSRFKFILPKKPA
jgi:signal transduction histidine kinase